MYLLISIFISLILTGYIYSAPIMLDGINTIVNSNLILNSDINNELKYALKNNKYIFYNNYDYYILYYRIMYMLIINNIIFSENIISSKQIENIVKNILEDKNINNINFFTPRMKFNFIKNKIYQIILNKQINNYIVQNVIIPTQEINILSQQIINKHFYKTKVKVSYFIINVLKHTLNNKIKIIKIINDSIDYSNNCLNLNKLKYLINKRLISIKKYSNNNWQLINNIPFLIKKHIKKIYKNILIGPICTKKSIYFLKVNNIYKLNRYTINNKIYVIRYIIINQKYFNNNLLIHDFNKIKKQILNKTINFNDIINKLILGNNNFYDTGIWFSNINCIHPIIKKIILNMDINNISNPIKIGGNWYIIQLLNIYNIHSNYLKKYSYLIILKRYFSEVIKIIINKWYHQSYINPDINKYE
ncbi:MAG: hypothetical protein N4P91_00525 [Candidatus Lightella neohaematopini]|nr:hypothetical protein [Candidatus Lightella neohaematopini]